MSLKWGDKKRWITEPKLKWSNRFSEKELKYFNKKIPKTERNNDWIIWVANCLLGKKYSWMIWAIIAICGWIGIGYLIWMVIK